MAGEVFAAKWWVTHLVGRNLAHLLSKPSLSSIAILVHRKRPRIFIQKNLTDMGAGGFCCWCGRILYQKMGEIPADLFYYTFVLLFVGPRSNGTYWRPQMVIWTKVYQHMTYHKTNESTPLGKTQRSNKHAPSDKNSLWNILETSGGLSTYCKYSLGETGWLSVGFDYKS